MKFSFSNNEGDKKKIGFLSSDFRNHAVGHQMIGLLENLDPEKYEFFLFSTSPHEDSDLRKGLNVLVKNLGTSVVLAWFKKHL